MSTAPITINSVLVPEGTPIVVGQVINVQPATKRSSRRVAYRGYALDVVREIDASGKPTRVERVFKPTHQYDPAVLSTNKYPASYSPQEKLCDTPQNSSAPIATPNTASTSGATTTTPQSSAE